MKVLSALNAFKEAPKDQNVVAINDAIAAKFREHGHEVESFPIADGGDGTIDAFNFHAQSKGGKEKTLQVKDPLNQNTQARWLHLADDKTAIIEMAQASGLALIKDVDDRNPLITSKKII